MPSAEPPFVHSRAFLLEPSLNYWSNKTNMKTNMTADQHYEWRR